MILTGDGRELPSSDIADYMNIFFATVGSNLASSITLDNLAYLQRLEASVPNDQLVA